MGMYDLTTDLVLELKLLFFLTNSETSPNNFKLEIFGNDLNKKHHEKATFDRIASLIYRQDEEDILVKPNSVSYITVMSIKYALTCSLTFLFSLDTN